MHADLRGRPGGQNAAEIEHRDLIADIEDEVGMMLDQQQTGAAAADRPENSAVRDIRC